MSFKNIKGQDSAVSFLRGAIRNNRLSHAYIFLGPSGVGRHLAALNFAKALNCVSDVPEKPCDACSACRRIDGLNHPDVFVAAPEGKSRSVKIEDIRGLITNIGLKPYEARKKVYIIDGAESLTHEASNALLKTLEEPPSESVIILITSDLGSLLRTIISRSQIVRFFALGTEEVKRILAHEHKMDEAKAHVLSHLADGSLGKALKFQDKDFFDKRAGVINGLAKDAFFDSEFDDISKEDLKLYLEIMLSWYRDILVRKTSLDASALINIDKKDTIKEEAGKLDFDYLEGAIKDVVLTNSFLDQNANPKIAMGALGLRIRKGRP